MRKGSDRVGRRKRERKRERERERKRQGLYIHLPSSK